MKLDIDGQIDSIHLFLSPRQVHLVLDMLAAIAGPGKYNSIVIISNSLTLLIKIHNIHIGNSITEECVKLKMYWK